MGFYQSSLLHFFLFLLVIDFAASSHISSTVLEPHGSFTCRTLLQQRSNCPMDFENLNYTVITSRCKGSNYTPQQCCEPLKELVCPVKDAFNDLKTNCADTFFSYLNLFGKYPPGLFAALCKEGKEGLTCPDTPPPSSSNADTGYAYARSSVLMMLISGLLMLAIF